MSAYTAGVPYYADDQYANAFLASTPLDNDHVVLSVNAIDTPGRANGNHMVPITAFPMMTFATAPS